MKNQNVARVARGRFCNEITWTMLPNFHQFERFATCCRYCGHLATRAIAVDFFLMLPGLWNQNVVRVARGRFCDKITGTMLQNIHRIELFVTCCRYWGHLATLLLQNSFEEVELPVRIENRRCSYGFKPSYLIWNLYALVMVWMGKDSYKKLHEQATPPSPPSLSLWYIHDEVCHQVPGYTRPFFLFPLMYSVIHFEIVFSECGKIKVDRYYFFTVSFLVL